MSDQYFSTLSSITALSPLDGRYGDKISYLRPYFSEYGLIRARANIEIEWLIHLSREHHIKEIPELSQKSVNYLRQLVDRFSIDDAKRVKEIENITNHDVKAIEYFLKEKVLCVEELNRVREFIHFACTSEDINNLSYALMLRDSHHRILLPNMIKCRDTINKMASKYTHISMISRTHGQPATPTTMGKELFNVVHRLSYIVDQISKQKFFGKINGAVGNFNAHLSAYPNLDWPLVSQSFVEGLGLTYQSMTTQIEPSDYIAEFCYTLCRFNTILIDLDRDVWGYISLNYFNQRIVKSEVGSSTMPYKVNPIEFENSEGNFGIANALFSHFAEKLPISRWQRDLTGSTVIRNLGVAIGHTVLAIKSMLMGLDKLEINSHQIKKDLNEHWEVITEAIQTVMRQYGIKEPYEKLKELTQGQKDITRESLKIFIEALNIPEEAKQHLYTITPDNYIGNAGNASRALKKITTFK